MVARLTLGKLVVLNNVLGIVESATVVRHLVRATTLGVANGIVGVAGEYCEVEMRSGAVTGVTHDTNLCTFVYGAANGRTAIKVCEMRIKGLNNSAVEIVFDNDVVAVAGCVTSVYNLACRCSINIGAVGLNVDAAMIRSSLAGHRIAVVVEFLSGPITIHGPLEGRRYIAALVIALSLNDGVVIAGGNVSKLVGSAAGLSLIDYSSVVTGSSAGINSISLGYVSVGAAASFLVGCDLTLRCYCLCRSRNTKEIAALDIRCLVTGRSGVLQFDPGRVELNYATYIAGRNVSVVGFCRTCCAASSASRVAICIDGLGCGEFTVR